MSSCDHKNLTQLFHTIALDPTPSEAQGTICGMLSVQLDHIARQCDSLWFEQTDMLSADVKACQTSIQHLIQVTGQQLASDEMNLVLCLPDDASDIRSRMHALIEWCEGFLFGVGLAGSDSTKDLSAEPADALRDFMEITRMDADIANAGEEDEQALAEVIEHVRIGAYMIFEDLRHGKTGSR